MSLEFSTGVRQALFYQHQEKRKQMTTDKKVLEKTFTPKDHWPKLKKAMEVGGAKAVSAYIEAQENARDQRQLYSFAVRSFDGQDWAGKNFDQEIDLARRAMACGMKHAEAESDAEAKKRLIDYSNIMSYNLSANLADCWPGDERKREKRHFEAGLKAAEDCLAWRNELEKGPGPFAMAHWARGIHLISLGRNACEDMALALDYGIKDLEAKGVSTEFNGTAHWSLLLYKGYLGLAEKIAGKESHLFEKASAYLEELAQNPDKAGDANFCLDQLRVVATKYSLKND